MNKGVTAAMAIVASLILSTASVLAVGVEGYPFDPGSPEAQLVAQYRHAEGLTAGLYGNDIVALAQSELEGWGGQKCGNRYCGYWGRGLEDWCCNFLYYLADQCGYVRGTDNTGDYPIFGHHRAGVRSMLQQLRNENAYIYSIRDETPQPGDVIFYYKGTSAGYKDAVYDLSKTEKLSHVGLVVRVDEDGDVHTIEGNTKGYKTSTSRYCENSTVGTHERMHDRLTGQVYSDNAILCLARPQYPYTVSLVGDLDKSYYFTTNNPDPNYIGHAVPDLTPEQVEKIKNTLWGEFRGDLAGAIAVAQTIRDNVDRSEAITYDNFPQKCQYSGYQADRDPSLWAGTSKAAQNVNTAFDYVFRQGGSAVKHHIYCFYSKIPGGGAVQTDEDYQKRFLKELTFVLEIGNTRFFSWEV